MHDTPPITVGANSGTTPNPLRLVIPKESYPGERRVALTPGQIEKFKKLGFTVEIQSHAGAAAGFEDDEYRAASAKVVSDVKLLLRSADVILKVRAPSPEEIGMMRENVFLASFVAPAQNPELLQQLSTKKISALALDAIPRTTRAQKMDVLSSMANLAGYRAVIEAAAAFSRPFTGQITAAGKMPPAKIMVIGAGVAGLAAIGAGRALGAIVRAFDTRPEVKDQITSMGAEFLELNFKEDGTGEGGYAKVMSPGFIKAEMELFAKQAKDVDIIISTALIPGVKAPVLITADMIKLMRRGSVVVDLAAEQGGNCELTKPGSINVAHGVSIIGFTDLPSRMASQASQLLGNNLYNLLEAMCPTGKDQGPRRFMIDLEDDIIRPSLVTHAGNVTWPPPKKPSPAATVSKPAAAKTPASAPVHAAKRSTSGSTKHGHHGAAAAAPMPGGQVLLYWLIAAGLLAGLGLVAPREFVSHLTVFVLACFIGWQVVWNVTPALHTPLMSVTNAISGIIVIGSMLQVSGPTGELSTWLAAIAILVATINIAGGFLVTQRMLKMFRK
jgi:NAD(P) transhydrogenase subunit alpha